MLSDAHLAVLRCPEDHTPLARAESGVLVAVNRRIETRELRNRGGETLERPIKEGLVRANRDILYPVADGIPRLLIEEGIPLSQIDQRVLSAEDST